MNPQIDQYLIDGCMRCKLGATPACKVNDWKQELILLREILLSTDLKEEHKWGVPCYTYEGKNVLTLSALKEFKAISFFKGSLLKDTRGLLVAPGENSQAARYFKVTDTKEIGESEAVLREYIKEAIALEKSGKKVSFKKNPEPIPKELKQKLEENAELEIAFDALTSGRQRGYILHFSQPKQSATRISRIEKCIPKILEGKGFHDR